MVKLAIAVGGPIASGKTTLSRSIAETLGAERRAFSDIVKSETARRGGAGDRLDLQQTGDDLIEAGWPSFVGRVLSPPPASETLVVDGIRHLGAINELVHQLSDARVVLVFVDPPVESVVERLAGRSEPLDVLLHHVETELPLVKQRADLVVGGVDLGADLQAVLEFLKA